MKEFKVKISCTMATDECNENDLHLNLDVMMKEIFPSHFDNLKVSDVNIDVEETD